VHVLVVSSAGAERELIAAALVQEGHTARAVATAEEAWTVLAAGPVDMIVCDLRLPEMNAQQLAERRRTTGRFQQTPMLLVLAHAGEQSHLVVQQLGAAAWVRSPVEAGELAETVARLVAV
jgi:two-component system response regulator AtoC